MRDVATEHLAELEDLAAAYLGDRSDLETISREELGRRLQARDIVVLDVRPAAEYAAGHIDGAISVPLENLDEQVRQLPSTAHVAAYCRGPYCVHADDAVRSLRRRGILAKRLEDGYPEWAHEGRPIAVGHASAG
ncbi:MAG: rhodanese-like domain-containing protein [Dermatophilaceae bacterium]